MDELVTHEQVMRWLSSDMRRELLMSLPPVLRGWYTREEAEKDGGQFVEVTEMSDREPRFLRTGD